MLFVRHNCQESIASHRMATQLIQTSYLNFKFLNTLFRVNIPFFFVEYRRTTFFTTYIHGVIIYSLIETQYVF